MLLVSGRPSTGTKKVRALVNKIDATIKQLHDAAAFYLSEAALACFKTNEGKNGKEFAARALQHAAASNHLSRAFVQALERAQSPRPTSK